MPIYFPLDINEWPFIIESRWRSAYLHLLRSEEMNLQDFKISVAGEAPPNGFSVPLAALWWDAKGDWARAHGLIDELETVDGMAVHAYLHRKEGSASNAEYWYGRAGHSFYRPALEAEWAALVEGLLSGGGTR